MGHRYPNRLRRKLVTAEAAITPKDRGVRIMPLARVDSRWTDVA
jgi:hypothetical protein